MRNTISAETSMLHTYLFLLYICLPFFLSAYHTFPSLSDKLSGYNSCTFDRAPTFQPVSLLFSDGRVHNPVPVLPVSAYLDIPLSWLGRCVFSLSRSATILLFSSSRSLRLECSLFCSRCLTSRSRSAIRRAALSVP